MAAFDCLFSLLEASNEAWHDNVKFTFEVNDGNFETYNNNEFTTETLFGGIIEYNDSKGLIKHIQYSKIKN